MFIFLVSDIHNHLNNLARLVEKAGKENEAPHGKPWGISGPERCSEPPSPYPLPLRGEGEGNPVRLRRTGNHQIDLILCAGDLTNWGNEADAQKVTDILRFRPLLTVPGNLDTPRVEAYLKRENFSIHGQKILVQDWVFIGFGGGASGFVGDIVYTEEDMQKTLDPLLKSSPPEKTILVTHQPPHGTKLDKVRGVEHKGSGVIFQMIDRYQPRFHICGHIHESWGEDQIGKTRCYNIAAVKEGRAAILDSDSGDLKRLVL